MEIMVINNYKKVYEVEISAKKFFANPYNKYSVLIPGLLPAVKKVSFYSCVALFVYDMLTVYFDDDRKEERNKRIIQCVTNYLFLYLLIQVVGHLYPLMVIGVITAFTNN